MSNITLRTHLRVRAVIHDHNAQEQAKRQRYEAAARYQNQAVAVLDVVTGITRLVPGLLDIPMNELKALIEQAQTTEAE